jgi:hypothetical protein
VFVVQNHVINNKNKNASFIKIKKNT